MRWPSAAACVAAACGLAGCEAAADRQPAQPAAVATPPEASFDERLRAADRPPPVMAPRNPFQFGQGARRGTRTAEAPLPAPEGLPELPLPLPAPPLKLLGVATMADDSRVAVILVGGDLVLARDGEMLAQRYRVTAIGEDRVELIDLVGERPVRLDLP